MPVVAPRQAPGAPAKFRDQPPPPSRPQDNGYPNRGPRIQQLHQHNGQVGPGAEASQTVPPASTGPPYIPDIRASLQMQHAIYEDMLASAAPEVKDVLAALIRSDPNFTADVDSFWLHTTRQLPTPEQLQMLRVLQGQYMVICELERQAELETAYAKNVAVNSTTSHAAGPAGPENQGLQPTGTDIASQASEAVTQTESKKSTQQDRRVEEGAKAEKVKRREAKPAQPYEKIAQVGEGTYGKVYKARNSDGLGLVALKRIRMEGEKDGFPVTAMREIKLLQGLDHVNIVKLHEMMIHNGSVHMVMEYMDHDLSGILSQPQITLSVANLKSFCQQMLRGLAYLHGKAILHRDMKGSNILINSKGELKLADFGLARYFTKRKRNDYTNRVVTLWYRSPELLLGETMYDVCIDNWSAGCIMLELFVRKPVFQGNDEIHQLEAIYEIMGTPTEEEWPGLVSMPWYELVKPKEMVPSKFDEYFSKRLNTAGTELAKGLLHYDPAKRLTADQALESPFFNSEEPAPEIPTHIADIVGEWHEMEAKHERARRKQRET
ncbi:kinase subunit of RNA polymerase II carboxy-terminal domain kinase I [Naganishia albida]|nr:kinase subunit of RNA polymerase II carboxy-terminal domain kinase I [Naganishia albida]